MKKHLYILLFFLSYLLLFVAAFFIDGLAVKIAQTFPHPRVTLVVPAVALFSYLVVNIGEEVKLSFLGAELKGLSARLVTWRLLFISVNLLSKALW